jgi:ABC-type nitrate/sulfonate/bicarbonate transport system substrate-binding protein
MSLEKLPYSRVAEDFRREFDKRFMNRRTFYASAVVLTLIVGVLLSVLFSVGRSANKAPETTITFLLDWKGGAYHAGFFVADAKGFYKNENLEVRFEEASGAAQAATIIGEGKYPLGLSTGDATLMAAEKGAQVVSIAAIYQRNPVVVFSLKSNPIRRPEDLLDKKVGIPLESIAYKEFLVFLRKTGLDQSRIQIVGVGFIHRRC